MYEKQSELDLFAPLPTHSSFQEQKRFLIIQLHPWTVSLLNRICLFGKRCNISSIKCLLTTCGTLNKT